MKVKNKKKLAKSSFQKSLNEQKFSNSFEKNKNNFLSFCHNQNFVGIPEFDDIVNRILDFQKGKIEDYPKSKITGNDCKITLTNGVNAKVSNKFHQLPNSDKQVSPNFIYKSCIFRFSVNNISTGIDFITRGPLCKVNSQPNTYPPDYYERITTVGWAKYSNNYQESYYIGKDWLGKSFPTSINKNKNWNGVTKNSNKNLTILNKKPIGNNEFIDNGNIYIIKHHYNYTFSNIDNHIFETLYLINNRPHDFTIIEIPNKNQFNRYSTRQDIEKYIQKNNQKDIIYLKDNKTEHSKSPS